MAEGEGIVSLGISVDLSSIQKSVEKAAESITQKFTASYTKASKNAEKEAAKIGESAKKAGKETERALDESSKRIQEILEDTEKSAKSKAASIGAIYKNQGMSSSAAMKKAWQQIKSENTGATEEIKKNTDGIKSSAEKAASSMKKSFSGSSGSIIGAFKKMAVAAAAAFSVHKIVDFGKQCLELGSDLQEVQNVVDVTFPTMSGQIDQFAKNAASSFGLSETMAKKFSGTFGSMAEAFGFSEKEAASMATTLTGLAGDVASFYNISQDEAYTKLKSVFSGETETLKDLGIVMTQSALDAYALANGYGKVTSKMTEAEKVSLRYAFVQDQLKNATGDFARTSDSWANQVRILSLQFDSLRASLGQGLINIFTPIIKQINNLMSGLVKLASLFKSFTELITGNKSKEGSGGVGETVKAAAEATSSLDSATDSANNLSDATTSAGKAAKKAAKQMLGLASFDELNNLSSSKDSDSSDGTGGSGSDSGGAGGVDLGALAAGDTVLDKTAASVDGLLGKFRELAKEFKKGFQIGLGNTDEVFSSIQDELSSIGKSVKDIFSDKGLQKAASGCADSIAKALGQVAGSIASVGLTIADNLLGGISLFLEQHKQDIIDDLTSLFDVTGQAASIIGNVSAVLADIITVFRSPEAKQITASLIAIFEDSVANIALLFVKLGRDLINLIAKPIIDNKDKIKEALDNTIAPLSTIIQSIETVVTNTWDKIQALYDQHIKPLIDSLADGFSGLLETFLDGYNKYVAPVLNNLAKRFKSVMDNNVEPAIDSIIGAFGDLCDTVKKLWEKWLQPFVDWCIKTIMPILAKAFEGLCDVILDIFSGICDAFAGLGKAFSGLCEIIQGIVDGDWSEIWEGIKKTVSGVCDAISGLFSAAWDSIKRIFSPVADFFSNIWSSIKDVFKDVASWFDTKFKNAYTNVTNAFKNIKSFFTGKWNDITSALKSAPNWFNTNFKNAYDKVVKAFSSVKSYFEGVLKDIKSPFKGIADWFEDTFSKAWNKVKDVFSTGGKIFSGIEKGISGTFKTVVNGLISGINKIIKQPFDAINGMLNKIRDVGVGKAKPFSGLWEENPIKAPVIPALASGGYVRKNTPQLAMIGDNRHQGEVVAPEDKLQELLDVALKRSGEVAADALIPVIERLCNAIIELENGGNTQKLVPVSNTGLYRIVQEEKEKDDKRKGRR